MNFIHKTTKFMHTKAIVRFTSTWPDKYLSQTRLLYLRIIIWMYSYELILFNYFIVWVIAVYTWFILSCRLAFEYIYHFSLGVHYYTWSKDVLSSFQWKHSCKYCWIIVSCLKWCIHTNDEYSWVHSHTNKTTAINKWATNPYLIVHQENLCLLWSKKVCDIISTRRMLLKWKTM